MVGTLRDVVPGPDQRLKLRERCVNFPGHGSLLRLLSDDLGGQFLEIAQHRSRELEDLDLGLELSVRRRSSAIAFLVW